MVGGRGWMVGGGGCRWLCSRERGNPASKLCGREPALPAFRTDGRRANGRRADGHHFAELTE